jgi:hypothetical protein
MVTLRPASLSAPFFQQHVLTSCLCATFWLFSQYFKLFHYSYYICYGDLWSVIFDVTIVIVLERHEQRPYKTANLIDKCVFWLIHRPTVPPYLSLPSRVPVLWDTTILKLDQLITLQWSLSV